MKVGLFFGSFNPIHIGHLAIANYMLEFTDLERVWFVVSPQNPLKVKAGMLAAQHRLHLVQLALDDHPLFRACDVEFRMSVPSYTIDAVTFLSEKHPQHQFVLIMGVDCLSSFPKWKNAELLKAMCPRYVYPRPGYYPDVDENRDNLLMVPAPVMEVSSSMIRQGIAEGKDMCYFVPAPVYRYIKEMHFYEHK